MLETNRLHTLLARGLLLFISLVLCMSLCVLAAVPAKAADPWTYLKPGDTPAVVIGIVESADVPDTLVIPEGVETIGPNALSGHNFTDIVFPSTLKEIGEYALSYCNGITEITIPMGVNVGVGAFSECDNLETVKVLYGGVKINPSAFAECPKLSKVELASDVSFTGGNAFSGASALTIFYDGAEISNLGASNVNWESLLANSEAAYAYEYEVDAATGEKLTVTGYHGKLPNPEVPDTINGKAVTHIAAGAFKNTPTIVTSVTLPPSVKEIEEGALPDTTDVTLKGYSPVASDYAKDKLNVTFVDQNLTDVHMVTVDHSSEAWLSLSYRAEGESVDQDVGSTNKSLELTPLNSVNKQNQVTVWINQMNTADQYLDSIVVTANTEGSGPGDNTDFKTEKSVYVIIADAQSKLTDSDTCVPPKLRRFTFNMPGANITVKAVLKDFVKGPTMPDSTSASPGEAQPSTSLR